MKIKLLLTLIFLSSTLGFAEIPVIKVGILFSATGTMADIGAEAKSGYQLGIEELKEKNKWENDRFKVQFFFEDSRSDPSLAPMAANHLIRNNGVHVILGDSTTAATLSVAPIAQSSKIPLLTPSATSDRITPIGNYIFRGCFVDRFQGEAMADNAYRKQKSKTAVVLVDMDEPHSKDVSQVFETRFKENGGQILKTFKFFGSKETSYVSILTELRSLNADVIYAPIYYSRMGIIFKQAKALGIKSQFLGTDAWDSPQLFSLAMGGTAGALLTSPFSYQNPATQVQIFRKKFIDRFKVEPSSYGALAYDSIFILENALSRLDKNISPENLSENIRNQLAKTKGLQGVTGQITIDQERNSSKSEVVILKLTEKGYVYHDVYSAPK